MEDVFSVAYQQTEDEKDLEYAYFGIFDGHGGREAAIYAKVSRAFCTQLLSMRNNLCTHVGNKCPINSLDG